MTETNEPTAQATAPDPGVATTPEANQAQLDVQTKIAQAAEADFAKAATVEQKKDAKGAEAKGAAQEAKDATRGR